MVIGHSVDAATTSKIWVRQQRKDEKLKRELKESKERMKGWMPLMILTAVEAHWRSH